MSVGMLMLSPVARGLFHRAISQSGVASAPSFLLPAKHVANNIKKQLHKQGKDLISWTVISMILCIHLNLRKSIKSDFKIYTHCKISK